MFPSLLYDQSFYSPLIRKCTSTIDEPLVLEPKRNTNQLNTLLAYDNKEILQNMEPQELIKTLSLSLFNTTNLSDVILAQCCEHLKFLNEFELVPNKMKGFLSVNDQLLLHLTSLVFRKKIVIYETNTFTIECQVINFGFTSRINLGKIDELYVVVVQLGYQEKLEFCRSFLKEILSTQLMIDLDHKQSSPIMKHKRSYSDPFKYFSDQKETKKPNQPNRIENGAHSPSSISNRLSLSTTKGYNEYSFPPELDSESSRIKLREKFIDEINKEGDEILFECNQILQNEKSSQLTPKELLQQLNLNISDNGQLEINKINQQSRFSGRLKFFDEQKNYGFIVMDIDGSDIFVHQDDLTKANVSKELLRSSKYGTIIRFSFLTLSYFGKYNRSRKAVELQLINSFYPYTLDQFNF